MTDDILTTYLATVDPRFPPLVRALHAAVREAAPELTVAVKYHMLMYAVGGDYRRWVCAIGVTKNAANLRFLYGVRLSDPARVLRAGTSHLMTWDIASEEALDAPAVQAYVREAVARHGE
jgi:hypothetical protein